jgi:hypothetical protein
MDTENVKERRKFFQCVVADATGLAFADPKSGAAKRPVVR